ncbi:MAG: DUF4271 domain-containing protein [Bacteroidetes bacterium]|nr:MAG: DUF4271 domain-containing protein [Bacteroidota bacterium]
MGKNNCVFSLAWLAIFMCLMMLSFSTQALEGTSQSFPKDEFHPSAEEMAVPLKIPKAGSEVFGNHELPATIPFVMERRYKDDSGKYVTLWIILSILMLSITKFLFPLRFRETLMACWESRYFNQFEREGGLLNNWVSFFLYLNFLSTISLLLYMSIPFLGLASLTRDIHPVVVLMFIMGVFVGFYLAKYLVMQFTAWVFKTSGPTESYFRNQLVVNQFAGIVILPLMIINYYNPMSWILYATWGILGILAIYKLIRVSLIGLRISDISAYHLILYLCAIELAPVIFVIKLSSNLTNS